jgi:hypothetical protein
MERKEFNWEFWLQLMGLLLVFIGGFMLGNNYAILHGKPKEAIPVLHIHSADHRVEEDLFKIRIADGNGYIKCQDCDQAYLIQPWTAISEWQLRRCGCGISAWYQLDEDTFTKVRGEVEKKLCVSMDWTVTPPRIQNISCGEFLLQNNVLTPLDKEGWEQPEATNVPSP